MRERVLIGKSKGYRERAIRVESTERRGDNEMRKRDEGKSCREGKRKRDGRNRARKSDG